MVGGGLVVGSPLKYLQFEVALPQTEVEVEFFVTIVHLLRAAPFIIVLKLVAIALA